TGNRDPIQVALQGDGRHYQVDTSLSAKDQPSLICKPGRHRLWVEFSAKKTVLFLDDVVLAQSKPPIEERSLRALRLACADADGKASFLAHGVTIARAQEEPKRSVGAPDQDEV